jgi:hypothetical protein
VDSANKGCSPSGVFDAVSLAVTTKLLQTSNRTVDWPAHRTVEKGVWDAVWLAVSGTVWQTAWGTARRDNTKDHPNLEKFVENIQQQWR